MRMVPLTLPDGRPEDKKTTTAAEVAEEESCKLVRPGETSKCARWGIYILCVLEANGEVESQPDIERGAEHVEGLLQVLEVTVTLRRRHGKGSALQTRG